MGPISQMVCPWQAFSVEQYETFELNGFTHKLRRENRVLWIWSQVTDRMKIVIIFWNGLNSGQIKLLPVVYSPLVQGQRFGIVLEQIVIDINQYKETIPTLKTNVWHLGLHSKHFILFVTYKLGLMSLMVCPCKAFWAKHYATIKLIWSSRKLRREWSVVNMVPGYW